ncbi:PH domain-containing protein [Bacillus sp. FJAT-49736]|uniref:PH domain-containing protein n=1 Tax=Bacillus sp. FJAT-49736 TaxID=2833582 RepID=UPI001BCA218A|nr:PH domain-containing protein [Bacillus sp. FJAT-49736]MBS4175483.1 PH domain-containing protein [Bacillus sp. FJAT-49736]
MMSERKKLHPITCILNSLKQLKSMIIPLIGLVAIGHKGDSSGDWLSLITTGIALIIVLAAGIVKWLRFSYRVEEGELRIEYGLFIKKKRYIPLERIQSLSFSEGILQRPFGLVKVVVETAGSNLHEAEAELTAIGKSEAANLEKKINEWKSVKKLTDDVLIDKRELLHYKISTKDLLTMSATSGGVGVILSAILALLTQIDNFLPYKRLFNEASSIFQGSIFFLISLIILGLIAAWLLSVLFTFLKYSNFTLSEINNDLIITRGMLEKRKVTIPLNRIQAIRVSENPIRGLFGYTSVFIESAGGNIEDQESRNILLLPMVKREAFPNILHTFLKDYHFQIELRKPPSRARVNYLAREIIKMLPMIVILLLIFRTYGLFSLCLLVYPFMISHFRYHAAGWSIQHQQLTLRYRRFLKHTVYMKKNRIQSIEASSTWFQKRKRLASIHSTVKSTGLATETNVRYLSDTDIETIYKWYLPN